MDESSYYVKNKGKIEKKLKTLSEDYKDYTGKEVAEFQTFINELFACYGKSRRKIGCGFEEPTDSRKELNGQTVGIMDAIWHPHVIFEGKSPFVSFKIASKTLQKTIDQALLYWIKYDKIKLEDRCRYVVLFNFKRFVIIEPAISQVPVADFELKDLCDHSELFSFISDPISVTKTKHFIADLNLTVIDLFLELIDHLKEQCKKRYEEQHKRRYEELSEERQKELCDDPIYYFISQNIYLMFLQHYDVFKGEEQSYRYAIEDKRLPAFIKQLSIQNQGRGGSHFKEVPYINGDLFSDKLGGVDPDKKAYKYLNRLLGYDWKEVTPLIFGRLFEKVIETSGQSKAGAFYTNKETIMKIVEPVVLRPFRERLQLIHIPKRMPKREKERVDTLLKNLLIDLVSYSVLDPACGSGNFLYVCYIEMSKLQKEILEQLRKLHGKSNINSIFDYLYTQEPDTGKKELMLHVSNMYGFDTDIRAIYLTRIVLHIAYFRTKRILLPDAIFPLESIQNVKQMDALIDEHGNRQEWPKVDAIVGNPPFRGGRVRLNTKEYEYNQLLRYVYKIKGQVDLVCYWFAQASKVLQRDINVRIGLIGTSELDAKENREFAIKSLLPYVRVVYKKLPWYDLQVANIVVCILCMWDASKGNESSVKYYESDDQDIPMTVKGVNSDLSIANEGYRFSVDRLEERSTLAIRRETSTGIEHFGGNRGGFFLTAEEAEHLMNMDVRNGKIIKEYIDANVITKSKLGSGKKRYIVDFTGLSKKDAGAYTVLFAIVTMRVWYWRKYVLTEREREEVRVNYWLFRRDRLKLFKELSKKSHFIMTANLAVRREYIRTTADFDNITFNVSIRAFALDKWYHFGVLTSDVFGEWNKRISSTRKTAKGKSADRIGLKREAYGSFSWIRADEENMELMVQIGDAAKRYQLYRDGYCLREDISRNELSGSPTVEYKHLTGELNGLVRRLYGIDTDADSFDILERLFELNQSSSQNGGLLDPLESISGFEDKLM